MNERSWRSRAGRLLAGLILVHALLVGAHLGEFWPFSIYQMFSSAGRTWTRAVVREVPAERAPAWHSVSSDSLPGEPVPLNDLGVSQNDLSVFIERTDAWTSERALPLTTLLRPHLPTDRAFIVLRVRGRLVNPDSIHVSAEPIGRITANGFAWNPSL